MAVPLVRPVGIEISSTLVPYRSGVGVFGRALIDGLRRELGDASLALLCRLSRLRNRRFQPCRELPLGAYVDGRRLHRRVPALHALDTRFPRAYRGHFIATVFDVLSALAVSETWSPARFRARKLRQYEAIAERADTIVTISEESRQRFLERFPTRAPVHVVYPGVDGIYNPDASLARLDALDLERERYLLVVGELCPRKNLEAVVEAFRAVRDDAPGLELALIGRPSYGWEESEARRQIAADPSGIRLLGFVDDESLAAAYAGALAVVYLSHYEGFGLPVLEAMASGAPVVASERGGIPEAAGEAAVLVDPDRPDEVARAVSLLVFDESERRQRRLAGLERAREFSWGRCARRIAEIYREVCPI